MQLDVYRVTRELVVRVGALEIADRELREQATRAAASVRSAVAVGGRGSKRALNAVTLAFAVELESTRIKVNAACPGFIATDLNNFSRALAPSSRAPASPFASRSSTKVDRLARSRAQKVQFRGEPVARP